MRPFGNLARRLGALITARAAERAHRRATRIAMRRFARLHPDEYGALFDEAFLERLPEGGLRELDAAQLAREWSRQFRYSDERRREREVRRLTPVAESFLGLVRAAEAEVASVPARGHGPAASEVVTPCGAGVRTGEK